VITHIIVTICYLSVGAKPACHDEDPIQQEGMMIGCMVGEAQVPDWKEASIFKGPSWFVKRVRCETDPVRLKSDT